jgi:hypothetical protein
VENISPTHCGAHPRRFPPLSKLSPKTPPPNCSPRPVHARCWPRPAALSPLSATSPILKLSPTSPSDMRANSAASWPWLATSWRAQIGSPARSRPHERATSALSLFEGLQRSCAARILDCVADPRYRQQDRSHSGCRPGTRTATDGPGRCAHSYGSDGPDAASASIGRIYTGCVAAVPGQGHGSGASGRAEMRSAVAPSAAAADESDPGAEPAPARCRPACRSAELPDRSCGHRFGAHRPYRILTT